MLQRRESSLGVVWYESPLLRLRGVLHAFSTRLGGVSTGVFASLNLGNPSGCVEQDARANILENEQRLLDAAGFGRGRHEVCRVHQVHGCAVARSAAGQPHNGDEQADAIVTADPERVVSVRVADCVPVLLTNRDGRRVSAVHAGWRGVVTGVCVRAIEEMAAADVAAAIGPSIGWEAFEVGAEVVEEFERSFGASRESLRFVKGGREGKWHVDLRAALEQQLRTAGVEAIDTTDRCTVRDAGEFFSHRRDKGVTGRMAAFIAPRG